MIVLALNETWAWCEEHGFGITPEQRLEMPAGPPTSRVYYAEGQRSAREPDVAARCVEELGGWDECLLWVTAWGIWPSGEDWPRYYAARGERGERRSLDDAPGHLFRAGDEAELRFFLTLVLENGWDAAVLPAWDGRPGEVRILVSHDEFVDTYQETKGRFLGSERV